MSSNRFRTQPNRWGKVAGFITATLLVALALALVVSLAMMALTAMWRVIL